MKVRPDFVTNSSSASFIVCFRSTMTEDQVIGLLISHLLEDCDSWNYAIKVDEPDPDYALLPYHWKSTPWKKCTEDQKRELVNQRRENLRKNLFHFKDLYRLSGYTSMYNDEEDIPIELKIAERLAKQGVAGLEYVERETSNDG